ncbi:MAG: hypothetical protein ABSG25_12810 [Bryobacteraceae bacterium]
MSSVARAIRLVAGVAVLAALAAFAVSVVPAYRHNREFNGALERIAATEPRDPISDETVRSAVQDRAARLGLRVEPSEVELHRSPGHLRIAVRYKVPVDLALYSVDLHFRAGGGN